VSTYWKKADITAKHQQKSPVQYGKATQQLDNSLLRKQQQSVAKKIDSNKTSILFAGSDPLGQKLCRQTVSGS
jgi:hypothetical protein